MQLAISHTTHYTFTQPVAHGLQRLRLRPKTSHGQFVREWSMALSGLSQQVEYDDHNHNMTTLATVDPAIHEVVITCSGIVETADNSGITGQHIGNLPLWRFSLQTPLTAPGPKLLELAENIRNSGGDRLDLLHNLSSAVLDAVRYEAGHTSADTSAEEAMAGGVGVCQDHAHIFIGAARQLGIPARYVSGYLMMNDRIDQDAGHAWAEAHVDGLGWVAFDISNGICPDERYVRVATGNDYREAAPVTGVSFGSGESSLSVKLAVEQQQPCQ